MFGKNFELWMGGKKEETLDILEAKKRYERGEQEENNLTTGKGEFINEQSEGSPLFKHLMRKPGSDRSLQTQIKEGVDQHFAHANESSLQLNQKIAAKKIELAAREQFESPETLANLIKEIQQLEEKQATLATETIQSMRGQKDFEKKSSDSEYVKRAQEEN